MCLIVGGLLPINGVICKKMHLCQVGIYYVKLEDKYLSVCM